MPLWSQGFAFGHSCFINAREYPRWAKLKRNQKSSRYSDLLIPNRCVSALFGVLHHAKVKEQRKPLGSPQVVEETKKNREEGSGNWGGGQEKLLEEVS